MIADIIIMTLIIGYCGYIAFNELRDIRSGRCTGCGGSCGGCNGHCAGCNGCGGKRS